MKIYYIKFEGYWKYTTDNPIASNRVWHQINSPLKDIGILAGKDFEKGMDELKNSKESLSVVLPSGDLDPFEFNVNTVSFSEQTTNIATAGENKLQTNPNTPSAAAEAVASIGFSITVDKIMYQGEDTGFVIEKIADKEYNIIETDGGLAYIDQQVGSINDKGVITFENDKLDNSKKVILANNLQENYYLSYNPIQFLKK